MSQEDLESEEGMEHVGLIAALLCSQKHQSGHGMKHHNANNMLPSNEFNVVCECV